MPHTSRARAGLCALCAVALLATSCAVPTSSGPKSVVRVASAYNPDAGDAALRTARLHLAFPHATVVARGPLGDRDSGNDVQLIEVDGTPYVYKSLPGRGAPGAAERAQREVDATQWAADHNFAPPLIYADAAAGFFVEGYVSTGPQSWEDGGREPKLSATLQLLRRMHDASVQGLTAPVGHPLDEARAQRALAQVHGPMRHDPPLLLAQEVLARSVDLLSPMPAPRVRCHGDVNPQNVLYRANATVFIDWASSHLGDPMFELATFADAVDLPANAGPSLLAAYGPHTLEDELRFARYLLLRIAVRLIEDYVEPLSPLAQGPGLQARIAQHTARLEEQVPAAHLRDPA